MALYLMFISNIFIRLSAARRFSFGNTPSLSVFSTVHDVTTVRVSAAISRLYSTNATTEIIFYDFPTAVLGIHLPGRTGIQTIISVPYCTSRGIKPLAHVTAKFEISIYR